MVMGGMLRTFLFFISALCIHGFIASTTSYTSTTHSRTTLAAKNPPLYTEAPDDEQEDVKMTSPTTSKSTRSSSTTPAEFVAIGPGSVVKIEVGDLDLARKAQKKRRRSESPLLVPCSIVSVSALLSFRWNVLYLRRKTGKSKLNNLFRAYSNRSPFQWTPAEWAKLLGMKANNPREICEELFPQQVRDAYGITLLQDEQRAGMSTMNLEYPKSPWRAVKLAEQSTLLGFRHNPDDAANLLHTGQVLLSNGDTKLLSTALRLHQGDETVQQGDTMYAVVSEFNPEGDSGEPLLKLTLKPSTVFRPAQRIKSAAAAAAKKKTFTNTVADLKVGDMLRGTVVRRVQNGVLIDCGVGRKGSIPVWGRMSFRDARVPVELLRERRFPRHHEDDEGDDEEEEMTVDSLFASDEEDVDETEEEEDEDEELDVKSIDDLLAVLEDEENEEGEDITEFFTQNEDGSLTFVDPDSGETQRLDLSDDNEEEEEEEDVETTLEDMSDDLGETIRETSTNKPSHPRFYESRNIQLGDKLKVYVKSVGANSSQFSLTLDPSVVGMKCKDIKNESSKNKKLSRLAKQLGGFANIRKLKGQESQGTVKATSKTGDWVYVQPDDTSLPVGVATSPEDLQVGAGDSVLIQFDGVDEARGQLAIKVLDRLAP